MIQKYFSALVILMCITVVSCRQDSELNTAQEDTPISKKEIVEGNLMNRSDSTQTGINPYNPPKNGTHYKLMDSLSIIIDITNPPKNGTHYKIIDSLSADEEITNPPKNGTHYKGKL